MHIVNCFAENVKPFCDLIYHLIFHFLDTPDNLW